VSRLEGAARAAAGLARQILDYSRDAADTQGRADLRTCVEEVAALMRHSLDPRIEVRVDAGAGAAPVPLAPGRVQQILMNLCCNARDAMPAGGVLELGVRVHGSEATLRVRDTGMGMTEEVRRRIFQPFFTTKEPGHGTGLGLAVCREIVAAAGGAIRVESAPGQGTLFEIHLPLAAAEAAPAEPLPEAEAAGGHTILVVDDEPLIRMVAERFLERAGFRVVAAENGEQALDLLRREGQRIDLVLLDLTMPGMRGPQVVAALRAFLPDLPVVITSGYSEQSVTQATWAHEVQGFLAKPFDRKSLLAAIARALAGA
ncbi:MAG: response regulator, partial [Nitrospirae bacterium]